MLASLVVANLAFAAIAWLAGLAVEALGVSPLVRARLWMTALLAAAAIAPGLWLVGALHIPSPWHVPRIEAAVLMPAHAVTAELAQPPVEGLPALPLHAVERPTSPLPLAGLFLAVLLAGAALRLAVRLLTYRKLARCVAGSRPLNDTALETRLTTVAHKLGAPAPQLRRAAVSTPLVLRRPRLILLPEALTEQLGEDALSLVCGHEIAHLKRGDDLAMAALDILACLFWFNPFMIAIDRRLSAAREEVCDRMAMGDLEPTSRRAYAETLVSTFKVCSAGALGPAFLGRRANPAKRRLLAVLEPIAPSAPKSLMAGAMALILVGGAGAMSLAFAGAPLTGDPWLTVHASDGLTDADRAWLIMRSVQNDIATQTRNLPKAPEPVRMTAFIDQSRAQVAEISARIKGKPISPKARQIDRENNALRDQQWALDDQWDRPPPAGKVRATVYCAPDQPCALKSVSLGPTKDQQAYGTWALKYAELVRKNQMPHAQTTDGILVKADLTPAVVAKPPDPALDLAAFFGMGPDGMPFDVVPPPET